MSTDVPIQKTLPKRSLAFLVLDSFRTSLDSNDFEDIYGQTVTYLTKGMTAFEYQRVIKPYCVGKGFSAKVFRLRLHTSKYLSLLLKLFLVQISMKKSVSPEIAKEVAQEVGLYMCDARRLYSIWKSTRAFRSRLKALCRALPEDKRGLVTEAALDTYFNSMYLSIYKYVKFITYSKLRFIAKSSNLDLSDLHNDLLAKVVQGYYILAPLDLPDAHVLNYLKRSAHNHAINMIKMETTQKRGRLISMGLDRENNHMFSLRMVSENQMVLTAETANLSYEEIHNDGSNNLEKFELEFSVAEILTKYKLRSKKYRLLKILMGTEDLEFSQWLRNRSKCAPSEDNVDVQVKLPVKDFNMLISEFLHVSEDKVNVFLFTLRKDLALEDRVSSSISSVSAKPLSGQETLSSLQRKTA